MIELLGISLPIASQNKMATKTTDAVKKLEEQLTCSICLGFLTNPKTLSCLHSFCHSCLEDLLDYNYDVKCPTCRSVSGLGEEGVDSLQTTFLVNNLMEVHDILKKVSGDKQATCDVCGESDATGFCEQCESFSCDTCLEFHNKWKKNSSHHILTLDELADSAFHLPRAKPEVSMSCAGHNKPLDIYCETCEELICQHCTVRIHRDHEYDVVSDVFENHLGAIKLSLVPVDKRIEKAEEKVKHLNEMKERLAKRGESLKEDIQVRIGQVMDTLFAVGSKLTSEVDSALRRQEKVVNDKVEGIEAMLGQLRACKEHVEQSLAVGSQQQVLSAKSKLIEHTRSILESSRSVEFQMTDNFTIDLHSAAPINQKSMCTSVGRIRCEGALKDEEIVVKEELIGTCMKETDEFSLGVPDDLSIEIPKSTCTSDGVVEWSKTENQSYSTSTAFPLITAEVGVDTTLIGKEELAQQFEWPESEEHQSCTHVSSDEDDNWCSKLAPVKSHSSLYCSDNEEILSVSPPKSDWKSDDQMETIVMINEPACRGKLSLVASSSDEEIAIAGTLNLDRMRVTPSLDEIQQQLHDFKDVSRKRRPRKKKTT